MMNEDGTGLGVKIPKTKEHYPYNPMDEEEMIN